MEDVKIRNMDIRVAAEMTRNTEKWRRVLQPHRQKIANGQETREFLSFLKVKHLNCLLLEHVIWAAVGLWVILGKASA